MKQLLNLLLAVCIITGVYGQKTRTQSLEISLAARHDQHAGYTTKFGDVSYGNDLKLYGKSYSLAGHYRFEVGKNWYLHAGVGYYRLGIDKVDNVRTGGTTAHFTNRPIDYQPDSLLLLYSTSKYHYHNAILSVGLYKEWTLNGHWNLLAGADAAYLYTVAQTYQTTRGDYKTKNNRPFALQVNSSVGVSRRWNQYYLSPRFVLPLYQQIKKDVVFKESPDQEVDKWFRGYGVSLTIGKYL